MFVYFVCTFLLAINMSKFYDSAGKEVTIKFEDLDQDLISRFKMEAKESAEGHTSDVVTNTMQHVPFLPIFSGTDKENLGKSEVSFEYWSHMVNGIVTDGGYSTALIRQAIRKSLRGEAAQVLLQIPSDTDTSKIISTLGEYYGKVVSKETSWQLFFSAAQLPKESVVSWKSRLEGLMYRATLTEELCSSEREERLKNQFWSGLCNSKVKEASRHRYDSSSSLSELFTYCRSVEQSTLSSQKSVQSITDNSVSGNVNAAISSDSNHSSKTEVDWKQKYLDLVKTLEQTKVSQQSKPNTSQSNGKDKSTVRCWKCKELGHYKYQCPLLNTMPVASSVQSNKSRSTKGQWLKQTPATTNQMPVVQNQMVSPLYPVYTANGQPMYPVPAQSYPQVWFNPADMGQPTYAQPSQHGTPMSGNLNSVQTSQHLNQ